jgi:hypothetical protein
LDNVAANNNKTYSYMYATWGDMMLAKSKIQKLQRFFFFCRIKKFKGLIFVQNLKPVQTGILTCFPQRKSWRDSKQDLLFSKRIGRPLGHATRSWFSLTLRFWSFYCQEVKSVPGSNHELRMYNSSVLGIYNTANSLVNSF